MTAEAWEWSQWASSTWQHLRRASNVPHALRSYKQFRPIYNIWQWHRYLQLEQWYMYKLKATMKSNQASIHSTKHRLHKLILWRWKAEPSQVAIFWNILEVFCFCRDLIAASSSEFDQKWKVFPSWNKLKHKSECPGRSEDIWGQQCWTSICSSYLVEMGYRFDASPRRSGRWRCTSIKRTSG